MTTSHAGASCTLRASVGNKYQAAAAALILVMLLGTGILEYSSYKRHDTHLLRPEMIPAQLGMMLAYTYLHIIHTYKQLYNTKHQITSYYYLQYQDFIYVATVPV